MRSKVGANLVFALLNAGDHKDAPLQKIKDKRMNIRCPKCRYEHSLRDAMREASLVEIIKMQADFAPHSRLVFEYAEMFDTTRPIKAAKLLRVLLEVHTIWTSGKFSFRKTPYTISKEGIVNALKVVCNKKLDLENHNYLIKVMIGIAEQEEEKRKIQNEEALKKKERGLQAGVREGETYKERGGMPSQVKDFIGNL